MADGGGVGVGGTAKRIEQQRRQNSVLFRTRIVVHKEPSGDSSACIGT